MLGGEGDDQLWVEWTWCKTVTNSALTHVSPTVPHKATSEKNQKTMQQALSVERHDAAPLGLVPSGAKAVQGEGLRPGEHYIRQCSIGGDVASISIAPAFARCFPAGESTVPKSGLERPAAPLPVLFLVASRGNVRKAPPLAAPARVPTGQQEPASSYRESWVLGPARHLGHSEDGRTAAPATQGATWPQVCPAILRQLLPAPLTVKTWGNPQQWGVYIVRKTSGVPSHLLYSIPMTLKVVGEGARCVPCQPTNLIMVVLLECDFVHNCCKCSMSAIPTNTKHQKSLPLSFWGIPLLLYPLYPFDTDS